MRLKEVFYLKVSGSSHQTWMVRSNFLLFLRRSSSTSWVALANATPAHSSSAISTTSTPPSTALTSAPCDVTSTQHGTLVLDKLPWRDWCGSAASLFSFLSSCNYFESVAKPSHNFRCCSSRVFFCSFFFPRRYNSFICLQSLHPSSSIKTSPTLSPFFSEVIEIFCLFL